MSISSIALALLKLALAVYGERVVGRWIAELRFWWNKLEDRRIKIYADLEYKKMTSHWNKYVKDRAQSSETSSSEEP